MGRPAVGTVDAANAEQISLPPDAVPVVNAVAINEMAVEPTMSGCRGRGRRRGDFDADLLFERTRPIVIRLVS